ncbi:pyridoxine 4-oxidase [Mesorhizobium sp. NBSH29]|uniref:GMC family oxidoreductase n=1 Tax=Mesorhizobium sp. NBSH29 TaxID=2654249 RepID=UPI0018966D98|nr:pyridoxine 4-oxidase [Mesorhizobium sp. NBSH29]
MASTDPDRTLHADIAIVGAGSAGALIAARLSEDSSRTVVLIEAGAEARDPDIWNPSAWPALQGRAYDWDYRTQPQARTAGRTHHWARGKVVGGSSCLHAMGYMRGHPDDFEAWVDATGDSRWGWEALSRAFRLIEDHPLGGDGIHGLGGPMPVYMPGDELSPVARAFIEAGAALGLPRLQGHSSGTMIGVTPNSLNIRRGRRVTVADAWLTPTVRSRPNLRICLATRAQHLVLSGSRVEGVAVIDREGPFEILADQLVLCSGALESPALLMRSGIGPEEILHQAGVVCLIALPGVGDNLQDHLLGAGNLYAALKRVPPSRLQHSESMAYMRAGDFTAGGQPEIVVGCGVAPIVSECFEAPAAGSAYSLLFGVTHPSSRGSIRISGATAADPLIIDPAYLQTERDRALFRQALEAARMIGHHGEFAEWRMDELLPGPLTSRSEIDDFIARSVITHHHPCGTCSMGAHSDAVVDAGLRLRGLDNLYVADASVIPSITSGPIHAAVLAIAETFAATMVSGR